MSLEPVKIGIIGLGTVGHGAVEVLRNNAREIGRRAGREIIISHVATRSPDKIRFDTAGMKVGSDPFAVVNDPELSVVIELIGGYKPAHELVLQAIANGKHVITANKALIALHGNEIFAAARAKGVTVAFEAAVAGGIPIIKAIREGLAANHIESIAGIINGTGNFILTEMREHGRTFADALADAQALGYAEANPVFDVEGIDAAHKLTILASIAFGVPLQFDKVYTEGISGITREDVSYAEALGYRIKHLGITRRVKNGIELRVHPTLIPEKRLIANVNGVMNAVLVKADAVGSTLYYGPGAGALPTASAVVADLVDVVRSLTTDPENRVPHLAFQHDALRGDLPVLSINEVQTAYYLRLLVQDKPGVLGQITTILGDAGVSIEAMMQKESDDNKSTARVSHRSSTAAADLLALTGRAHASQLDVVTATPSPSSAPRAPSERHLDTLVTKSDEKPGLAPIIFLTHPVKEQFMNDAIRRIEALPAIDGKVTRIRVEDLS